MTTPPGQEPRSGSARGGPARPAPRAADSSWPDGGQDGRGTGSARSSTGSGRDGADRRRGGGDASGTGWRAPRPARDAPDPWRQPKPPERGRAGAPGAAAPGAGQGGNRGAGQGWGSQVNRGPIGREARERASQGGGDRGQGGAGRGYPDARGDLSNAGGGGRDGRGPTDRGPGLAGLAGSPAFRWLGALQARTAILIVAGAALLGVIGTLLTGGEPGFLLSLLIIAGTVVAAIGIQRRSVYLLIPLPALAFFLTAVLTGAVHDRSIDTSKAELLGSFLQWIANVFFAMCATTIIVVVIAAGRWLLSKQLVSGQFLMSAGRPGAGRGPRAAAGPGVRADRAGRPPQDHGAWGGADPRDYRGNPGGQRPNREQSDIRDPRGDRGRPLPPDRDPWGQRDQRSDRDRRGSGNPRGNSNPRDPRDPWGRSAR